MIRLLSYRFVTINRIRPEINILIDIHFRIRLIIYSKNSQTPSPALFTTKNWNYFLDNFQDVIIITNNRSTVTAFQRVIDSKLPQTAPFPTFPLKSLQNAGENICQAGRGLKYRKLEVIRKKKGRGVVGGGYRRVEILQIRQIQIHGRERSWRETYVVPPVLSHLLPSLLWQKERQREREEGMAYIHRARTA